MNPPSFPLEEGMRLRPCGPADVEAFHRVLVHPEVHRYLLDGEEVDRAWVETVVADSQRDFDERGAGLWLTEDSGRVVGFAGFRDFFEPPRHQLLYGLLPEVWGRGLATRASRVLLDHAFDVVGLERVETAVDGPNGASVRVLERLGFRRMLPAQRELRRGALGEVFFFDLAPGPWRAVHRPRLLGEQPAEAREPDDGRRVVFLCTHNSARSQMAEALFRHHWGGGPLRACSAGVEATGMHELAAEALRRVGIDGDRQVSKTVDTLRRDLSGEDALEGATEPLFDIVVTVCDNAREACPYLPARRLDLHRSFEDPSSVEGSREEMLAAFERIRDEILRWLEAEVPGWLERVGADAGVSA